MQTLQEIQSAVTRLSREELILFREWFQEFDAALWDRQLEEDVNAGKLARFGDRAIADFQAGKCKEI
ncbi:MAG: hypothetical protein H5U10_03325 [Desulfacinum sp.]|jgi:hypothetical protein|nr:hypothetical protein [Desulfacinum sp.]